MTEEAEKKLPWPGSEVSLAFLGTGAPPLGEVSITDLCCFFIACLLLAARLAAFACCLLQLSYSSSSASSASLIFGLQSLNVNEVEADKATAAATADAELIKAHARPSSSTWPIKQ